jgi:hypothetical protein
MKRTLLIAIFIAAISVNAFAKDHPESILRSLPASIKTYIAGERISYQDKRLGASIGYNSSSGISVTIYLYDLGATGIKDGIDSAIIIDSKNMAVADIREAESSGFYRNVIILSDKQKSLELKDGTKIALLHMSFTYLLNNPYTGDVSTVVSDLYLTALKGYVCKVRVSRPAGLAKEDEGGITEMLRELFSYLKK